ncbi:MAG: 3-oxoadipyl-CoA thiolase [Lysobacteraceae bacterium]|nr:MAG: 3-oxoadipyl-CoA thiolase [Xanthomonadaceae bacterium]
MSEAFICDAIRTPIGRYGGILAAIRADDLGALPIRALLARNPGLDAQAIEDVFYGCANQAGEDNRNVARMSLLLAGLPVQVPGVTLNRLCASGLEAVGQAARAIRGGELSLAIAGGVESMTRAPFVVGKPDAAYGRGQAMEDTTMGWRFINPRLRELWGTETMPQTGENVARDHGISREDQDAFALRSQQRAAAAQGNGFFAEEIVPVTVPGRKKGETLVVDTDEHPRAGSSLEALAKLEPVFAEGTVTAGNASGINDGAAALIIAGEAAVKAFGLTPRARILGMAAAGVEPRVMGIGPVSATQKLMARLGLQIGDFDAIELNEAFASQSLAVLRALGLPDDAPHVNANGGAIALGHPLGMSGARLALTLVHQLNRTGGKRGLATLCIGVGMGLALVVERV